MGSDLPTDETATWAWFQMRVLTLAPSSTRSLASVLHAEVAPVGPIPASHRYFMVQDEFIDELERSSVSSGAAGLWPGPPKCWGVNVSLTPGNGQVQTGLGGPCQRPGAP